MTYVYTVSGKDYHCVCGTPRYLLQAFNILPVGAVMCEIAFSQPRSQALPEREYLSQGEPGIFLPKHDVMEMVLKQKGNVQCIVQPALCSMLVYDTADFTSLRLSVSVKCEYEA